LSQTSILLHESSHFTAHGNTEDATVGCEWTSDNAQFNPAVAVRNAYAYEFFSVNPRCCAYGQIEEKRVCVSWERDGLCHEEIAETGNVAIISVETALRS